MLGAEPDFGCLSARADLAFAAPAFLIGFLLLVGVVLMNMLIAMFAKTFDWIFEAQAVSRSSDGMGRDEMRCREIQCHESLAAQSVLQPARSSQHFLSHRQSTPDRLTPPPSAHSPAHR